jgi:hypothetical protein
MFVFSSEKRWPRVEGVANPTEKGGNNPPQCGAIAVASSPLAVGETTR